MYFYLTTYKTLAIFLLEIYDAIFNPTLKNITLLQFLKGVINTCGDPCCTALTGGLGG